ncbi:MAG: DUF4974 domain-containing protein, partial [Bacteroidota bacterium]
TKTLDFDNEPLINVVEDLKKYFGVEIQLESGSLNNCPFKDKSNDPALEEIFSTMRITLNVAVDTIPTGGYLISGKGCK